jgi:hypothetical protein
VARIEILPATADHGRAVAANMRPADIAEVWALGRHSPLEAIERSLNVSGERWTFLADDMPLAIFGCSETTFSAIGSPWLLGAVGVERFTRQFLELGQLYVSRWALQYHDLYNFVDARNERSIDWLGRLGFKFADPILLGPDGCSFLPFHLRGFNV